MSTTKYTPGPWAIHSQGAGFEVESNHGDIVAQAQQVYGDRSHEVRRANARLIAAAPELLEAIEETLTAGINWYETATKSDASELGFVVRARATIAKAKGES